MFGRLRKGIRRFMDERIKACKEVLSSDKNLWTLSWLMMAAGFGLMISIYSRVGVPKEVI